MTLVTTKEILLKAQKEKYAVGAFNVENMEMVIAVLSAAEEMNAPVIMQTTPSTLKYAGVDYFFGNVKAAADKTTIPVALHLDHGTDFALAVQAMKAGYTSIMIDGSHNEYEENIAITKRVVDVATAIGIPVEAELGKVGGKEDDLDGGVGDSYTNPEEAKEFVERTGVSSLAVAIGTAHGFYKGEPKLDFDRLSSLQKAVSIPLVLHGASGVPDVAVQEAVQKGMAKVNFATELRVAYSKGIKEYLKAYPETYDPKKYNLAGMDTVKELVKHKIEVCGSRNKA
jgi:tagatose 1,6-diphosphate aldolase GatY/KbaY